MFLQLLEDIVADLEGECNGDRLVAETPEENLGVLGAG
jgi:hypothetical protein